MMRARSAPFLSSMLPALCLVLAVAAAVAGILPTHLDGAGLVYIVYYYWVMHRPDVVQRFYAVAAGLCMDALLPSPFGLHTLLLLIIHEATLSLRSVILSYSFLLLWAGAAVVLAVAAFIAALLSHQPHWPLLAAQVLLTALVFPLLATLFARKSIRA
ncbi:MAG: hypothetical protein EBZ69_03020 [Alphaproteobacteria bacterium]|nr:hypothetical protein [Alphaproteobacteria bacterium]NDC55773.1 hypothetical protein [Alphaproteobacteria bacterium]